MIKRVACALVGLLGVLNAVADSAVPQWSNLDYHASKFFVSVNVHLELARVSAETAAAGFVKPRRGEPMAPTSPEIYWLDVTTKILTQESRIQLWLDTDGSALHRESLTTGRKYRYRAYRYLKDGAYSIKRMPRDGEKKLPFKSWTDVTEDDYLYDPPTEGMSEGEALFIVASTAQWKNPGDVVSFPVFSPDGLGMARATYQGMKKIKARYEEISPSGTRDINASVDAMHITFNIDPIKTGVNRDAFELIGLQNDINLYVDPRTRVLLQLSGDSDSIGDLEVKLRRVVLK